MNTWDHKIVLGRPTNTGPDEVYRTSARQERARVRSALREGAALLKSNRQHQDAHVVENLLAREWTSEDPRVPAWITHEEWRALSRAVRVAGHSDPKVYGLLVHRRAW